MESLGTDRFRCGEEVLHYQVPKAASHYEIDTPVEQIEPTLVQIGGLAPGVLQR